MPEYMVKGHFSYKVFTPNKEKSAHDVIHEFDETKEHKVDPEEAAAFFDTVIAEYEDLCDGYHDPTSQEIDEFCAKALRGFFADYYALQLEK